MKKVTATYSHTTVDYFFNDSFSRIGELFPREKIIIITDENIYNLYEQELDHFQVITIPAGEQHKQQSTIDSVIAELLEMQADKEACLVGVGGGVVTDITGYCASIFKRGIRLGLVPTSLLAMVDAAVGGKNGVDVGVYKNMVGTIYQPEWILFDVNFLRSLPMQYWQDGFAEIIKHASIRDAEMFHMLQEHDIPFYKKDAAALAELIERNVAIKTSIVVNDETEKGDRKLLNFGHTLGHAVENISEMSHGQAVSVGMMAAAAFSLDEGDFSIHEKNELQQLLTRYGLPVSYNWRIDDVWQVLLMDKKRSSGEMSFVLLHNIGNAYTKRIPLETLQQMIHNYKQPAS